MEIFVIKFRSVFGFGFGFGSAENLVSVRFSFDF